MFAEKILLIFSILVVATSALHIECELQHRGTTISDIQLRTIERVEISRRNTCIGKVLPKPGKKYRIDSVSISPESKENIIKFNSQQNDYGVKAIDLDNQSLKRIPRNFADFFIKLFSVSMNACQLVVIRKEDLMQFPDMTFFSASFNKIRKLRSDLFEYNKNIQVVNFASNYIITIGDRFLETAPTMRILLLESNSCVSENFEFSLPGHLFEMQLIQAHLSNLCPKRKITKPDASNDNNENLDQDILLHSKSNDEIDNELKVNNDLQFIPKNQGLFDTYMFEFIKKLVKSTVQFVCSVFPIICLKLPSQLSKNELNELASWDPCEFNSNACSFDVTDRNAIDILNCLMDKEYCVSFLSNQNSLSPLQSWNPCKIFPKFCESEDTFHIRKLMVCKFYPNDCDRNADDESNFAEPPEIARYQFICDIWPRICGKPDPKMMMNYGHNLPANNKNDDSCVSNDKSWCLNDKNTDISFIASEASQYAEMNIIAELIKIKLQIICAFFEIICEASHETISTEEIQKMEEWEPCKYENICSQDEINQRANNFLSCLVNPDSCTDLAEDPINENLPEISPPCEVTSKICNMKEATANEIFIWVRCKIFASSCLSSENDDENTKEIESLKFICEIWPRVCGKPDSKKMINEIKNLPIENDYNDDGCVLNDVRLNCLNDKNTDIAIATSLDSSNNILNIVVDLIKIKLRIVCAIFGMVCGMAHTSFSSNQIKKMQNWDPCKASEICEDDEMNQRANRFLSCLVNPDSCTSLVNDPINQNLPELSPPCEVFSKVCNMKDATSEEIHLWTRCKVFNSTCTLPQNLAKEPNEIKSLKFICKMWPRACGNFQNDNQMIIKESQTDDERDEENYEDYEESEDNDDDNAASEEDNEDCEIFCKIRG